jgi:hypothetical protein
MSGTPNRRQRRSSEDEPTCSWTLDAQHELLTIYRDAIKLSDMYVKWYETEEGVRQEMDMLYDDATVNLFELQEAHPTHSIRAISIVHMNEVKPPRETVEHLNRLHQAVMAAMICPKCPRNLQYKTRTTAMGNRGRYHPFYRGGSIFGTRDDDL